ncbi:MULTISPECIES: hypothetical protein [Empedobacter]|uniref:Uncharacterized protein n=1 Tax=Empedobacter falsenii TaxID=343874 RepID=A0A376G2L5_9FLAO|nr:MULTISPECIES: hypothetical protein [Empedobacter]MDH0660733.1 hypothetical protein [Empedobacter sp. GD03865]MDH0675788.1 hypothetical protein [Empedobacter sp. GD03861]STD54564.1 Uncharacterised protein [Empedobacter falsenii]
MESIFCDLQVIKSYDEIRKEVKLVEETTGQSIIVGGLPEDSLILKLDVDQAGYKKKSSYLRSGVEFIHKGCDYCVIIPSINKIVLFELKSNQPKGYADQFVASEIFLNYCNALWKKYNNCIQEFDFVRVLLSPKFNGQLTSTKDVIKFTKPDRTKEEILILSPGFPPRIRIEKFLN